MKQLSKTALFIIAGTILLLGNTSRSKNMEQTKKFKIKAYMLQIATQHITLKVIKKQVKIIADAGYNTIILQLCSSNSGAYEVTEPGKVKFNKWKKQEFMDIVEYIRSRKLKVGLNVRTFTKNKGVCSKLEKKYPGIMMNAGTKAPHNKWLNPFYKFPDGRTAMEAVQLPMIDFVISLCGTKKPDFILLANDEGTTDSIYQLASKHNTSAPELFAWFLNTCSDYVIKKGITPIMWGDMFLSKRLGKLGHGVIGFAPDSRFINARGCFNAEFLSKKKNSILTSMNYLKNKDKIIIADWHYSPRPGGEFPSVDYFKKMGFKEVWGVSWYNDENIAQFARYASQKGCSGMLSCSFHTMLGKGVRHLYPVTIYNAICYYNNPQYIPPQVKSWHIETQSGEPVFDGKSLKFIDLQKYQNKFIFKAIMPNSVKNASGYLELINNKNNKSDKIALHYNALKHEVTATFSLAIKKHLLPTHYSIRYCIILKKTKFIIQKTFQNGIIVSNKPAVKLTGSKPAAQLDMDFSSVSKHDMENRIFKSNGTYSGYFYVGLTSKKAKIEAGALNCGWAIKSYMFLGDGFWDDLMKNGTKMTLEFKLNKASKQKKQFTPIISYGGYNGGICVMLSSDMSLIIQIRNKTQGLIRVNLPHVIPKKWYKLEIMLSKPDSKERRTFKIYLNGKQEKTMILSSTPRPQQSHFIAIACFINRYWETLANLSKSRFYGSIRKISYEPLD